MAKNGTPYFPNQGLRGIVRERELNRASAFQARMDVLTRKNAARLAIVAQASKKGA